MKCAFDSSIKNCKVCDTLYGNNKENKMSDNIFDIRGKALKVGTNVVYPVRSSSRCWLETGKITAFQYEDATGSVKSIKVQKKGGKIVTITRTDRLAAVLR